MIRRGCVIKAELMSIGNKKQTTLIDLRDAGMALEIPPAFLCFQDLTLFIPTPLVAWWPFWAWIERLRNGKSWLESFTQLHSLGRWNFAAERPCRDMHCLLNAVFTTKRPVLIHLIPVQTWNPRGVNLNFPFRGITGHTGFFSTQVYICRIHSSVRVSWVSCSTFLNGGSLRALQLGRKRFVPCKTQRWSDWQCSHPFAFTATSVVKPHVLRLNQCTGALDWQIAVCHVVYYVVPAACSMVL